MKVLSLGTGLHSEWGVFRDVLRDFIWARRRKLEEMDIFNINDDDDYNNNFWFLQFLAIHKIKEEKT